MKRALVFGGGGSKGAYEIGVWKAMDELGIPFDIVIGTSIGALIGMLYIQQDFTKACKIWHTLCIDDVIQDGINFDLNLVYLYKQKKHFLKLCKTMLMCHGMDITPLNNLVIKLFDEEKFFASSIDFACTTVNVTKHRPQVFYKKAMTKETAIECVLASASCFPAFPLKKIDDSYFIDGGYYDNVPITLARSMGATQIVAVDLKSIGRKKIHKPQNDTIYIEPFVSLGSFLMFETTQIKRNIQLGYQDAMKKYKIYLGTIYTFHQEEKEPIQQLEFLLKKKVTELYNLHAQSKYAFYPNGRNIHRIRQYIQRYHGYDYPYVMLLEHAAYVLGVNDIGIYSLSSFIKQIQLCINDNHGNDQRGTASALKRNKRSLHRIYHRLKTNGNISYLLHWESCSNIVMGYSVFVALHT